MKKFAFILFVFFTLFTCTKENITSREYPRVETKEVTDISGAGAVFHGEITFSSVEIIDHGFVWSSEAAPTLESGDKITLGIKAAVGVFEATVSRSLLSGHTYYVKSYVKSSKYTVYGEEMQFISLGGKAPKILKFSPTTAQQADTISIVGSNFSYKIENNVMQFGTVKGTVTSASDTLLRVTVPFELLELNPEISVTISGNKGVASDKFKLIPPQLISADKTSIKLCDTLTLTGIHLPNDVTKMMVQFNDRSVPVLSKNGNKLKVRVPVIPATTTPATIKLISGAQQGVLPSGINYQAAVLQQFTPASVGFSDTLTVSMSYIPVCGFVLGIGSALITPIVQTATSFKIIIPNTITGTTIPLNVFNYEELLFTIAIPRTLEILSITPSSGTFDDVLTIKGRGFHPDASKNTVCFNCGTPQEILPPIISNTIHEIKIKVPRQIAVSVDGKLSVGITTVGKSIQVANLFQIKSPIITSIDPLSFSNGSTVKITGQYFNPDAQSNVLTQVSNSKALDIVSATPTELIYNVTSDKLSVSDPYLSTDYTTKLILSVSGQQASTGQDFNVTYKGPWTLKADFPGTPRVNGARLSFDDKILYGLGNNTTNATQVFNDFWQYDPTLNQWAQLGNFPGAARRSVAGWVVNGMGYVAFGLNGSGQNLNEVWQFNPTSQSWTQLSNFPGTSVVTPYATVLNGEVYVLAGNYKQFWKYNPSNDSWTRLNDFPNYSLYLMNSNTDIYSLIASQDGGSSSEYKLSTYSKGSDSWTAIPGETNLALYYYFSSNGKLFGALNQFILYNEVTRVFDNLYFPGPFNNEFVRGGFSAQGKTYMIKGDKTLYELDLSFYPPH